MPELDMKEIAKSMNGFEEVYVKKFFGDPFEKLDGMMGVRSLYAVVLKRQGMNDSDAYRKAMNSTVGFLSGLVRSDEEEDNRPKDTSGDQTKNSPPDTPTSSLAPG